jgi:protein-tyrosine phosphatase
MPFVPRNVRPFNSISAGLRSVDAISGCTRLRAVFVDLHSHVLPALDDGAKRLEESLDLMRLLAKMGFDTVCATPHQRVGLFVPSRESIDGAHSTVAAALPADAPRLLLGAENMWDELFLERTTTGGVPAYTGGRAFLFELPVQLMPPKVEERLFAIRRGHGTTRLLPVMAHPERYPSLWDDLDRVEDMRRQAALVVDLGALDGAHGAKQAKAARAFVENGLAHAAATDCHSTADLKPAGAGIAWIRKRLGESAVRRLLDEGPRQILNGELPD